MHAELAMKRTIHLYVWKMEDGHLSQITLATAQVEYNNLSISHTTFYNNFLMHVCELLN